MSGLSDIEVPICFIAGAPRSGTTLLQAIVSTSTDANDVTPESKYFAGIVTAYERALRSFDAHTKFYFGSLVEFRNFNRRLLQELIALSWEKSGRPRLLVLKDPALTGVIPALGALLSAPRFLIAVRDPRDVIASRVSVLRRRKPAYVPSAEEITYFCLQYADYYGPLVAAAPTLGERLAWARYEDFAANKLLDRIEKFLGTRFDLSKLWSNAVIPTDVEPEWGTALLGGEPSTKSIGSHLQLLSAAQSKQVTSTTASIYAALEQLVAAQSP